MSAIQDLLDYRRRVAALYAAIRQQGSANPDVCAHFRAGRDIIFKSHPQSALSDEQKRDFHKLNYYNYDPAWRFLLPIEPDPTEHEFEINLPNDGPMRLNRFGEIRFDVANQEVTLAVYWINAYGGGLFLPFRDVTCGHETYGAGRYLLDTIKHADLGEEDGKLVIDFNYAYNPSCAYNERWVCPLAPSENRIPVAITAGEKVFAGN